MNKFNEYVKLLEADLDPEIPMDGGDQPAQQQNQVQPVTPTSVEPASVGYTFLAKIALEALKNKQIRHPNDVKYSDNKIKNSDDAFSYILMVTRNLSPEVRKELHTGLGKHSFGDVDDSTLIDFASIAKSALFFNPKKISIEYNNIANTELTPENAKQIIRDLLNYLEQNGAEVYFSGK